MKVSMLKNFKNKTHFSIFIFWVCSMILISAYFIWIIFFPPRSASFAVPDHKVCTRNLNTLSFLINKYCETKGDDFAPILHDNKTGRKLSWRVGLFNLWVELGKAGEFAKIYDLEEENIWEKDKNLIIAPAIFYCPMNNTLDNNKESLASTSYLMLVRDKVRYENLSPSAVIIVESTGCNIHWMHPVDINLNDLISSDSPFGLNKLNSNHPEGVKCLCKNGRIITIKRNKSKEQVIKILEGN
jgi:hypothetical protein